MVPQTDGDRALSALLLSVLASVHEQLAQAVWNGFAVAEPDAPEVSRARLVHVARLRVKATQRDYNVSAHLFDRVGVTTAAHDHRYPLAVFPFAATQQETPLYAMTWSDARDGTETEVIVHAGDVWAIAEPRAVRHTVRTLAPHASIILADMTDAPTRDDRMVTAPLAPGEITRVREQILAAFSAHRRRPSQATAIDFNEHDCGGPDVED